MMSHQRLRFFMPALLYWATRGPASCGRRREHDLSLEASAGLAAASGRGGLTGGWTAAVAEEPAALERTFPDDVLADAEPGDDLGLRARLLTDHHRARARLAAREYLDGGRTAAALDGSGGDDNDVAGEHLGLDAREADGLGSDVGGQLLDRDGHRRGTVGVGVDRRHRPRRAALA